MGRPSNKLVLAAWRHDMLESIATPLGALASTTREIVDLTAGQSLRRTPNNREIMA